ncbi:hypothetical protein LXL04_024076 [Taraxacum kok-saghyz]
MICQEFDGGKFYLLVDETRDKSNNEKNDYFRRFVNGNGLIIEHFFGLVHVPDIASQTLKSEIYSVLKHYNLDVKSIRGQGYDGENNMRGDFKGLQAYISKDCPYAYYVNCFAHRLQLALMAASQQVEVSIRLGYDNEWGILDGVPTLNQFQAN